MMNERIQELADRLWRVHPSDIDAMGLKTRTEFYEHELKKFAELIVRECVSLMESEKDYYSNPIPYESREYYERMAAKEDAFDDAGRIIKSHFGVK